MAASKWFPQQLVAFLEAVWSATTEAEAGRMAVERAAEALDAEIAAIVRQATRGAIVKAARNHASTRRTTWLAGRAKKAAGTAATGTLKWLRAADFGPRFAPKNPHLRHFQVIPVWSR